MTILIEENTIISAAEIGVLATVGKSNVKVAKQPKVMIVSTGDELVGVDEIPLEHQIRRSNVFTLVSLLEKLNISSETDHITDDKPSFKRKNKSLFTRIRCVAYLAVQLVKGNSIFYLKF